jgi:YVTN family beta-propeller protein
MDTQDKRSGVRKGIEAIALLVIIAGVGIGIVYLATLPGPSGGLFTVTTGVNTATLPPFNQTSTTVSGASTSTTSFSSVLYTYDLCNGKLSAGNASGSNGGSGCYLQPEGVLFDPDNGLLYVSHTGAVTVMNATSNSFVANIGGIQSAEQMVYDGANHLIYATNFLSYGTQSYVAIVSEISPVSNSVVGNITVGTSRTTEINEWGIALDPTNGDLYVAVYCDVGKCNNGNLSVISTASNAVVKTITGLSRCSGAGSCLPGPVFYDSASATIYIGHEYSSNITLVNPSTNTPEGTLDLTATAGSGASPLAFTYDSSNGLIYAADEGTNKVTVIVAATNAVNETIGSYLYSFSGGYFLGGLYGGNEPWGIAYDPSSNLVYVANFASGNVTLISCSTDSVVGFVNVGAGPRGMAYDPANGYVYVADHYSDTISILT